MLAAWSLEVRSLKVRRSVVFVEAVEGHYCLKPIRKSQSRLEFMQQVQEHARSRGFARLQPLVRTTSGAAAVWRDGVPWTLTAWVEGRDLSYDRLEEVRRAARVLAGFHVAASEFQNPEGRGPTSNIGKWPAKLASRTRDLLAALDRCSAAPGLGGEFGAELAGHAERLTEHSHRSVRRLASPAYADLCRPYLNNRIVPVCHGDPAAHNFIVRSDGEVELIDLNSLRADLPCVDLWKLISRLGFHHGWEPGALTPAIKAYCEERPLAAGERGVLLGLLWFPEKLWRLTVDAAKADPDWMSHGGHLPARLVGEMRAACESLELKEQFIAGVEPASSAASG
ncbi:MAG: hypothetical protein A2Y96_00975 [Firmicutes bacterium RBG_13_65_8]|nr:MAG: hypothetical protein A2Y96_00975 [Firmicutes bacterium RBG_13_65_8]